MRIRWQKNVFVRHADDESVVWHPRTGGCTVMKDVQPFLDELKTDWRDEREVAGKVVEKFSCGADDVENDVRMVLDELAGQGFLECTSIGSLDMHDEDAVAAQTNEWKLVRTDDDFALEFFCKRHDIPAELHIDLTDACTERCVHCYVPQGQQDYLPYEMIERALREFRAMSGLSVHLTGGECMMHPDFEKICSLCVELNLNFLILSNMTLCNEKRIAFLKEVDPQFINVSLYSMDAAEHDAITRLPGSWQKTMDAILACEKVGVHIRLATPLLKANQNAFPALKQFADAHHMHLIPSCDIVPRANHTCANLCHACSAAELERALSDNKELFNRNWEGKMPNLEDRVCDIGAARLYLNAKGNYYPCDSMHEYVLGNVRTHTVGEIWRGEKLEYLRSLKNRDFGACASCEHRPFCKVCPAFNFNATGDLFRTIPEKCALSAVVHGVYGGR